MSFGWELILEINGSLYASQVCRNAEQILTTSEQWKLAMIEKGWHRHSHETLSVLLESNGRRRARVPTLWA